MRALLALLLALLVAPTGAATLGSGNYDFTLKVDDCAREYFVHVPPRGSIVRLPVLILRLVAAAVRTNSAATPMSTCGASMWPAIPTAA